MAIAFDKVSRIGNTINIHTRVFMHADKSAKKTVQKMKTLENHYRLFEIFFEQMKIHYF